jgi:homoserine kinase
VRFTTDPVLVEVPATSANLGPGFDTLGLALDLADTVRAAVTDGGVRVEVTGEGAGQLPDDERHLIVRAARTTFDRLGGPPPGLALTCHNRIPHARGLGSSSAAIVAGVLAARALVVGGTAALDDAAVLRLAAEFEGHPDNVAPCLYGGLTIAWTGPSASGPVGAHAVRLDVDPAVRPVVFVPASRSLTEQARAVLPATVPHGDAAANAGRAALLVHALTGAPDLLLPATEDRLHQSYRAAAMPDSAMLISRLRAAGIPAVLSGAGPTVLAFLGSESADAGSIDAGQSAVEKLVTDLTVEFRILPLAVRRAGATVFSEKR